MIFLGHFATNVINEILQLLLKLNNSFDLKNYFTYLLDVDVAQPIAQKTMVQEVLGSIPCFAANVKTLL